MDMIEEDLFYKPQYCHQFVLARSSMRFTYPRDGR
jgi:hypothetical protein